VLLAGFWVSPDSGRVAASRRKITDSYTAPVAVSMPISHVRFAET
jgi:hypothetical protein